MRIALKSKNNVVAPSWFEKMAICATDGNTSEDFNTASGQQIPVLPVNLERLVVGYQPETNEEIDSIQKQLVAAMWARYQEQHLPE